MISKPVKGRGTERRGLEQIENVSNLQIAQGLGNRAPRLERPELSWEQVMKNKRVLSRARPT